MMIYRVLYLAELISFVSYHYYCTHLRYISNIVTEAYAYFVYCYVRRHQKIPVLDNLSYYIILVM